MNVNALSVQNRSIAAGQLREQKQADCPQARALTGRGVLSAMFLRRQREIITGTVLLSGHQMTQMAVPIIISKIIVHAFTGHAFTQLSIWLGVLLCDFVLLMFLYQKGARLIMRAIATEADFLRTNVSSQVLSADTEDTYILGDAVSLATSDVDSVTYLIDYIPRIVAAVLGALISCGILLTIHWQVGLIAIIGAPAIVGILQAISPMVTRRVAQQQKMLGITAALSADIMSGLRTLHGVRAHKEVSKLYRETSDAAFRSSVRAICWRGVHQGGSAFLGAILSGALALEAGYLALGQEITLAALISAIGIAQYVMNPFITLALVPSWVAESYACAQRLAALPQNARSAGLSSTSTVTDQENERRYAAVTFNNVSGGSLHQCSFCIPRGAVAAIVANAEDTASFFHLCQQRLTLSGGTILIGERRLDDITDDEKTKYFLAQHCSIDLFQGTIADNITFFTSPLTPKDQKKIKGSAEIAEIYGIGECFPRGLDHHLCENGGGLSGGQRQRIALARAVYHDPDVLLLDNPTSHIDAITEEKIFSRLIASRGPATTIIFTTSLSYLKQASHIFVLDRGKIRARGRHQELLKDPSYRKAVALHA